MDTETKYTVEIYDNLTGEHYERECTAEELAFYEELAKEQNEALITDADTGTDAG